MAGTFSFIKHPMLHLLQAASDLVPGIEKVVVVYYDSVRGEVVCKGRDSFKEDSLIDTYEITSDDLISKLRNQNCSYKWTATENMPFETCSASKRQLVIFDEEEHLILSIGLKNEHDNKTDLIYLYMNGSQDNFGVPGKGGLTTGDKAKIGAMLNNSFTYIYNQHINDSNALRSLAQKYNDIQSENRSMSEQLNKLQSTYSENIVDVSKRHVELLGEQYGCEFILSKEALSKIEAYTGNTDELKSILTHTATVLLNLNVGDSYTIVIKEWDIQLTTLGTETKQHSDVQDRYQKTFQLLEKLEQASRTVLNQKQKLTSENVGGACPQPITAPAISDALRNHQKKVVSLMQKYPDKWKTIRNEFRPVKNILNDRVG